MVTITRSVASGFRSLVNWASARVAGLLGVKRAPQPPQRQSDGSKVRDAAQELVESKRKNTGMAMQTLRSSLKAGKITQEEYLARVAQLSEVRLG